MRMWCWEGKTQRVGWLELLVSYCLTTTEAEKLSHSEEESWVCGPLAKKLEAVTIVPALWDSESRVDQTVQGLKETGR